MTQQTRTSPPKTGDELATLSGFLDFLREAIVVKVSGLDDESLRRPMTPSGVSLLGIVKHLAYVERYWFAHVFDGLDVAFPWTDEDPDADWRIEPDESTQDVLDLYLAECDKAREVVARSTPDQPSVRRGNTDGHVSLRWIVTHMVEETGRHAGHADILREQLDGQTGQ